MKVSELRKIIREMVEDVKVELDLAEEQPADDKTYEDIITEGFWDKVKSFFKRKPTPEDELRQKMKDRIAAGGYADDVAREVGAETLKKIQLSLGETIGILSQVAEDPASFDLDKFMAAYQKDSSKADEKMLKSSLKAALAARLIANQLDKEHFEELERKAEAVRAKYQEDLNAAVAVLAGDSKLADMLHDLDAMKASNLTAAGKTRKVKPYTATQISAFSKEITDYCNKLLGKSQFDVQKVRSLASKKIKSDRSIPWRP